MAKGYWVSCYQSIDNPDKLAAYAKLAAPAIIAGGGKFIVRGPASKVYEQGLLQPRDRKRGARRRRLPGGAARARRRRQAGFSDRRRSLKA